MEQAQQGLPPASFGWSGLEFWFQRNDSLFERKWVLCQAVSLERVWRSIVNAKLCAVLPEVQGCPDALAGLHKPGTPVQITHLEVSGSVNGAHEMDFSFGNGQGCRDFEVGRQVARRSSAMKNSRGLPVQL